MRKIFDIGIDLIISVVIGILLTNMIHDQMVVKQDVSQELQGKISQQYVNKAISLLTEDHTTIKRTQVKYPQVGEAYAVIHNDDRDFIKKLYFGDSEQILGMAIGQYKNSGIPGEGRPILLAGHNGTHFYQLRYFEKGDHVMIDTDYGNYVYEITHMEIMAYYDFDETVLEDKEEYLIMYCCYPFDALNTDQRYFVYAKKLDGPQITGDGSWKE